MPPPIVPAPTTAARLIVLRRRVLRHVGHLGDLALGEEQMAQRLRFGRDDAVGEQLALAHASPASKPASRPASIASTAANGARMPVRGLRRATRASPRTPRARAFTASALMTISRDLADLARRRLAPSRTRSRRRADRRRRSRSMMPAAERLRRAATGLPSVHISSASAAPAQARQPLRAAGAGNDAEQHFRLADLARRSVATRKWHACATSRPPPSALP